MCTYEDLLKDTAVACKNEDECRKIIEFLKSKGHYCVFLEDCFYEGIVVDILNHENENPDRAIMRGRKSFYRSNGYKIINFQEVDLEERPLEVMLNDFELLLLE